MRRDEQRSPVLVFLATTPSLRHAIAGDGERVVGRGTIRHTVCSIYGSNTHIHPSISFIRLASGGGGVGVYQPSLGRQGSETREARQRGRQGKARLGGGSWQARVGRRATMPERAIKRSSSNSRVGRLQQSSSDSAQRPSAPLAAHSKGKGRGRASAVVCAKHNRFGMLARTLSR